MKPIYTTIPVELCGYALKNKKVNHLLVYVYLKHIASGHIIRDSSKYEVYASDLGISSRTIRSCINWMVKNKWITVNNKKNGLRIISYKQLCGILGVNYITAVKYDVDHFNGFKGFCAASIMTYYLKRKAWSDRKQKWSGSKMGDSSMSHSKCPKGFYTLPIRYFAICMGISNSTANNYKQAAVKSKYVVTKRNVITMKDDDGNKIGIDKLIAFSYVDDITFGRIRKGMKYLKKVESDYIRSSIYMTSKRRKNGEKR